MQKGRGVRLNKNKICEIVWEFIRNELDEVTRSINNRLRYDKQFYWKGSVMDTTCNYIRDYLKETINFRDVTCQFKSNKTVETILYFDDSSIPSMVVVPMTGVQEVEEKFDVAPADRPVQAVETAQEPIEAEESNNGGI